ncbi:GatB/YqeY domain-containing protein [bacterium]|nr:GatB/YqeY domain-containing protein [candidate division CSSED10-310 bacterium]
MLIEKLTEDMKKALKAGDKNRLNTLRLVLSELKYAKVEKAGELDDEDVLVVIRRGIKKRHEAIDAFRAGGRDEAAAREEEEMAVLTEYMPRQITGDALTMAIRSIMTELDAQSKRDFGRVMKEVMARHKNVVDGAEVKRVTEELLG